jgi:hypothetical protein
VLQYTFRMTTLTLKTTSKKKLNLIEELAKELGILIEKSVEVKKTKTPNSTTLKAIKETKAEKMNIIEFRKLLYS